VLLGAGCDDAHVVACFGDQDFCRHVITTNVPPEADAGTDQQVAGGESVSLDGSASHDPDGYISSYSWAQLSGTAVTLSGADQAVARFDAPDVNAPESLVFRLTVVDDDRAAAEDEVTVQVRPAVSVAAQQGFALLSLAVAPVPVLVPEPCTSLPALGESAWFAQAGLWLAVHALALDGADDAGVTRFLDAARLLLAGNMPGIPSDPLAASFWFHGIDGLRRFAHDRDPALADLAERWLPVTWDQAPALRLMRGEITLALIDHAPAVVVTDTTRSVRRSVDYLRTARCRPDLDPIRLASDTMFLLAGAAPPGSDPHRALPGPE